MDNYQTFKNQRWFRKFINVWGKAEDYETDTMIELQMKEHKIEEIME